ncbi:D-psicose/D-tagatose/L-ribulose 3-epimerase [Faunimonas pinastri]|uniref:D-psicose/D-tagatose/L-ribulose 3-epimerase n=1 Tax=Faunimonas pinastri TaxID=1855383 RepID=A0A1H9P8X6_9HYPH|nr:sugar phosphate isomerase/epimerase family protein [Faunimonas pinastri]SER44652.1 D-psicose/D-tagatose/L-ribulose 3-epimerase [Faunimonas pinastri]
MARVGVHSFVWGAEASPEVLDLMIDRSKEAGFDLVEFSYLDPKAVDVDRLARRLTDSGMKAAISIGLPPEGDVSSEDDSVVAAGKQMLQDAISLTRDLGGDVLAGILFSAHRKYERMPSERNWRNSVAAIAEVAENAKPAGVTLNLEVVNRFESNLLNTLSQGVDFIRETGADNVFLHADTFHMNIEEAGMGQAIRQAGAHIGYVHIGESHRGPLGTGTIDFPAVFDALQDVEYAGDITFESFSRKIVDRELSLKTAIWRDLWSDNVELARHARGFIEQHRFQARQRSALNG